MKGRTRHSTGSGTPTIADSRQAPFDVPGHAQEEHQADQEHQRGEGGGRAGEHRSDQRHDLVRTDRIDHLVELARRRTKTRQSSRQGLEQIINSVRVPRQHSGELGKRRVP
jgi:hypothetical protein